jgi:hypothetical protein
MQSMAESRYRSMARQSTNKSICTTRLMRAKGNWLMMQTMKAQLEEAAEKRETLLAQ